MMAKRVEVSVGGTERKRVCVSDQQSAVVREEEKGQLRRFDGLGGFKRRESDVEWRNGERKRVGFFQSFLSNMALS